MKGEERIDGPDAGALDRGLVERMLMRSDLPCIRCGYNLRGLGADVCPECGVRIDINATLRFLHRKRPVGWWFAALGASSGALLTVPGGCLFFGFFSRFSLLPMYTWMILACVFVLVALEWVVLLVLLDRRRLVDRMALWRQWTIGAFTWWPHATVLAMLAL